MTHELLQAWHDETGAHFVVLLDETKKAPDPLACATVTGPARTVLLSLLADAEVSVIDQGEGYAVVLTDLAALLPLENWVRRYDWAPDVDVDQARAETLLLIAEEQKKLALPAPEKQAITL